MSSARDKVQVAELLVAELERLRSVGAPPDVLTRLRARATTAIGEVPHPDERRAFVARLRAVVSDARADVALGALDAARALAVQRELNATRPT